MICINEYLIFIYGLFTFLDQFANFILRIFPFYFIFKIIFLIWCFMPNTMGALFIYNKFVAPYFKKYEDKIDKAIDKFIREGKLRGKNKNHYATGTPRFACSKNQY